MNKWEKVRNKLVSKEEAKEIISEWKSGKKEVGFTNGCFDILHQGHVTYLAKAADLCNHLVVAVNSDASVKRLGKSPERPINEESSRAIVIASLEVIDLVIIFDEDTPKELIQYLMPSVLVKGADYNADELDPHHPKYIVGSKEVKLNGGKVKTIPLEEGFSTTNIVNKIK